VSSRRDRLGKGLGALIGEALGPVQETEVRRLRLESIVPNPLQPRQEFSEKELEELADSIRQNGLMQPITVRPSRGAGGGYELVAGERRLRAVRRLGWEEVSAVVRDVDDDALLVLALVENLQREALDPLEEAEGYKALQERFSMTQEEIARAVGRERSTVANIQRLLKLPPSIRKLMKSGKLSMGHARALLSVEDPGRAAELGRRAAEEGWSVREVERRTSLRKAERTTSEKQRAPTSSDPIVRALEEALRDKLSTRVLLRGVARGKGTIEIPFDSDQEFERLFAIITGREASEVVE
jgi:ParB family transcriptional regulator, chromosome partitioning protein